MSPEEKNISPLRWRDLAASFVRILFLQVAWNFERYLNYGFAFVLMPVFKRIYPVPEERAQALSRHMEYFNTHPYMASFVLGAVIRMEEEKQQLPKAKQKGKEEEISALKVGMMGPIAAMGDNLFWATVCPYCGLIAVTLVLSHAFQVKGQYCRTRPSISRLSNRANAITAKASRTPPRLDPQQLPLLERARKSPAARSTNQRT